MRARFVGLFLCAIRSPASSARRCRAILGMDGIAGLHGWQWLFLIEGVPSLILAFAVLVWLPDRPAMRAG